MKYRPRPVNTAIASYVPSEALLTRIGGTDVWFRSYPARNDARFVHGPLQRRDARLQLHQLQRLRSLA